MTKREALRQTHQENVLISLGFSQEEAESLRRISMTLHRWYEKECGNEYGCIERDEETGRPYWVSEHRCFTIADREKGAQRRLVTIMTKHPSLGFYLQTDPRGAALYIIRPGDIPEGATVDSCYYRGICVF